jgi:dTDP-4-amino-4,6-dideoxygalactose transaminase
MFVIRLDGPNGPEQRETLARYLKEKGIESGVHYPVPNHRQPAIEERFGKQPALPRTEDAVRRILSLPMFPTLTDQEVRLVASEIRAHLRA